MRATIILIDDVDAIRVAKSEVQGGQFDGMDTTLMTIPTIDGQQFGFALSPEVAEYVYMKLVEILKHDND